MGRRNWAGAKKPEHKWLVSGLKEAQKNCGLSGNKFAKYLEINTEILHYYYRGKRSPSFWQGVRLANKIGLNLAELMTGG